MREFTMAAAIFSSCRRRVEWNVVEDGLDSLVAEVLDKVISYLIFCFDIILSVSILSEFILLRS